MSDFASLYGDYADQAANAIRRRREQNVAYNNAVFYGQQRGTRALEDLSRKFREGFQPRLVNQARRGLGRSGVRERALRDYAQQYERDLNAQTMANAQGMSELGDTENMQQRDLDDYLARLRLQKQREIMGAANILSSIGAYGG